MALSLSFCGISLSQGFKIFEELANSAIEQESELNQNLLKARQFIIECKSASQDVINASEGSPIPYDELADLLFDASYCLEQRDTWRFDCHQALEVHLAMCKMEKIAAKHEFLHHGLYKEKGKTFVAPWGIGCELLLYSYHGSRDMISIRTHLLSILGDRDYFKTRVEELWPQLPELHIEFPLNKEERMANQLLSFRRAVKDKHEAAFASKCHSIHGGNRLRKGLPNYIAEHAARARATSVRVARSSVP